MFMLGPVKCEVAIKHPNANVEVAMREKSLESVSSLKIRKINLGFISLYSWCYKL